MSTRAGHARDLPEFAAVDRTADSSWFIRFMDAANAIPEYTTIRQRLGEALGNLSNAKVLDVGCGTGDDARQLAKLAVGGRVIGVDVSAAMVEEARRRDDGREPLPVEYQLADMCTLPFADRSFDATRAKLVRLHCEDLDAADNELVRVTRPGGRIAIFDYDAETLAIDHPDRRTTRDVVRCWVDGYQHGWAGRQLRR
jgi:ubiquinone/menaquinone biosynthesis C-methylase UbiE